MFRHIILITDGATGQTDPADWCLPARLEGCAKLDFSIVQLQEDGEESSLEAVFSGPELLCESDRALDILQWLTCRLGNASGRLVKIDNSQLKDMPIKLANLLKLQFRSTSRARFALVVPVDRLRGCRYSPTAPSDLAPLEALKHVAHEIEQLHPLQLPQYQYDESQVCLWVADGDAYPPDALREEVNTSCNWKPMMEAVARTRLFLTCPDRLPLNSCILVAHRIAVSAGSQDLRETESLKGPGQYSHVVNSAAGRPYAS